MMSICLSVCLSVCLSPKCKNAIFSKTNHLDLELCCLLTTYRKLCKLNWAFQRTHYWIHTSQDGWNTPSWKSTWRHFFLLRVVQFVDKILQTGTEWHVDCGGVWKWKPDVEFQYGGRLGELNGMSSQSHVSHCRVLPLDKFTVTIPEPYATLQAFKCNIKNIFCHFIETRPIYVFVLISYL